MTRNGSLGPRSSFAKFAWFLVLTFAAAAPALRAQDTGTILGDVKDASGASVPRATIIARDLETGQSRTTVTADDGAYRFSGLRVGPYEVRAGHAGMETSIRTGLTLTVSQEAVVNFTLQVQGVQQTVSVTGEAPVVNTTSAAMGGLVDQQSVVDLPLNGRSFVDLAFLQPGVIDNKNDSPSKGSVGHYFSSNGATPRSNNYLLDGASMVTMYGASSASVDNTTLGVDGILEYKVITTGFSAEYGMTMGSQMLIVSKGGTNGFHGSAFEFFRNSVFDARNYFDAPQPGGRRLPEFHRNDFGGSFGGPIRKDRTFFFGVYEGLREHKGITTLTNDLPAGCRGAANALVTNAQCTQLGSVASVRVAPVIVPFLAMYPLPNLPNNQFTYPYSQPSAEDYGQIRVDHNFSSTDTFFARYTADNSTQEQPTAYPEFLQGLASRGQFLTFAENHIFSPSLLNSFRASYSRTVLDLTADLAPATAAQFNNPSVDFVPGFPEGGWSVAGFTGAAAAAGPIHRIQNLFAYSDDLIYTRGKHSLKFGALVNRFQQFINNDAFLKGSVTFPNIAAFLQGLPSQITAIKPGGTVDRTFHYYTLGFYAQDDIRVTKRFTANLGLRYEFETMPVEVHGAWSALIHPLTDAAVTVTPNLFGENPSLKNFSPRVGFAWDVFGNGKTAVRGGFGLLYDIGNYASLILQTLVAQPPFTNRGLVSNPGLLTVPFNIPPGNSNQGLRPMDYFFGQPKLLTYSLAIERQLPFDMGLSLAYVGSQGLDLDNVREGNPSVPQGIPQNGACVARPGGQAVNTANMVSGSATACWLGGDPRINLNWPSITDLYQDTASSWYNSFQAALNKRITKGLQFQAAYTLAKTVDQNPGQLNLDTGNSNSLEGVDSWHIETDQGLCACDVRNNFKFNLVYYLPNFRSQGVASKVVNGWWISSILSLQSGQSFSVVEQSNRSRSGTSGGPAGLDRPNLVPGRSIESITNGTSPGCGNPAQAGYIAPGTPLGTPSRWFDPCAFAIQPAGFLGNAGRDIVHGPGLSNLDFSLVKDTPVRFLGESGKVEFRSEVFNVLNHANFALPNRVAYSAAANVENPLATAGVITSTITTSRQIQFALKLLF